MILKDNPVIFNQKSFNSLLDNFEGEIPLTRIEQEVALAKNLGLLVDEDRGDSLEDWFESVLTLEEHGLTNILVLDTETTDVNGYTASIATRRLILSQEGTFEKEDTIYSLINPLEKMNPEATEVNKLTDDMLINQPTFSDYWNSTLKAELDWADIIVAQNAIYDIAVILREAKRSNLKTDQLYYLDTMSRLKSTITAKDSAGKLKFPNETEIANFYGVKTEGLEMHNAKVDVNVLSESFIQALTS